MSALLADAILVVHFTIVVFIVGGLFAVWIGAARGWRWIRSLWFRLAHLGAIVFVAAEAVAGAMCPLTVWEDALRGRFSETGFVERWLHAVLFYDLPAWVFTAAYVAFALVVLATFIFVPPRRRTT
jgi:hypothetical protein